VSRYPGPWAGSMFYTDDVEAGLWVLLSRNKWDRAKRLLATLHGLVLASEWVDHKVLERIRGFSVYVVHTYHPLTPFIMGLNMSIYGWRSGRGDEGWILREDEVVDSREPEDERDSEKPPALVPLQPPRRVKAVPRLLADLEVMRMLTAVEDPPLRRV
jgi:hypothetical protein